jgi:hypothetical protein
LNDGGNKLEVTDIDLWQGTIDEGETVELTFIILEEDNGDAGKAPLARRSSGRPHRPERRVGRDACPDCPAHRVDMGSQHR